MDQNIIKELRKLHREQKSEMEKALDDVDIDHVLENGTEAERHVLNKAHEQTHVGDPLVKSLDEVTKATDELDRYALSKRRDGETVEDAHDRLTDAGDPRYCRLYEATTSGRL